MNRITGRASLKPHVHVRAAALVMATALCGGAGSARADAPYHGTWALSSTPRAIAGYLRVSRLGALRVAIDFWEQRDGKTVRTYDAEMTKLIHLVVIASDFSTFAHLHPTLLSNGHFVLRLDLPKPATYLVYADTVPRGEAQAVFRFRVPLGMPPVSLQPADGSGTTANAGPYVVRLSATHRTGRESTIVASISENGEPATDLHPYLGAAAHVVLIDTRTLAYVHVHPVIAGSEQDSHGAAMTGMPGMAAAPELAPSANVPPQMSLHLAVYPADTYRMWFQFRGGNAIYVAPFLLKAH